MWPAVNFLYLALGFGLSALAGFVSYHLFSHVRTRVFAFLDPWKDIAGKGYQITQSLFAIGTGGFLGLGLFQGLPKQDSHRGKRFYFLRPVRRDGRNCGDLRDSRLSFLFMQMMMMGMIWKASFINSSVSDE